MTTKILSPKEQRDKIEEEVREVGKSGWYVGAARTAVEDAERADAWERAYEKLYKTIMIKLFNKEWRE